MPEEVVGVAPDSPPADAPAASSAEQDASLQQPSGTAPPPPSQVVEPKPWNLPPEQRWDELRRERDEARRAYQELATRASQPVAPIQPVQPQADPWESLVNHPDPATAQFYQQQRRLVEHAVQQGREQAYRELQPVIGNLQRGQAAIGLKDFRKENPDIQPGSEEEFLVVAYMEGRVDNIRHPIESARNNAVIRKLEAEVKVLREQRTVIPQKRQAAGVEATSGIPATAGLPPKPGDWREQAGAIVDKGGGMLDVAQAIFGRKRQAVSP